MEADHATSTRQPDIVTVDGVQVLHFDATEGNHLTSATGSLGDALENVFTNVSKYGIVVVAEPDDYDNTYVQIHVSQGDNNAQARAALRTSGSENLQFLGARLDSESVTTVSDGLKHLGKIGSWHTYGANVDLTAQTVDLFLDGLKIYKETGFQTSGSSENVKSGTVTIGSAAGTSYFEGHIRHIFLCPNGFTDREMYELANYAANLDGLPCVANRAIVLHGDSIMANTNVASREILYMRYSPILQIIHKPTFMIIVLMVIR